ncbi:MAG: hypothetical protein CSA81_11640 [Acidobacteria bacterium]|nr:MAG: hypothetical protein CSA81_11640 [Acidobacteriota bacterium]
MNRKLRLAANYGFASIISLSLLLLVRSEVRIHEALVLGFLIPSLFLMFAGRLIDNLKNHLNAKIWALTLASILVLVYYWTGIFHFLSVSLILSFWAGHLIHYESSRDQDDNHWPTVMSLCLALLLLQIHARAPHSAAFFTQTLLIMNLCFFLFLSFLTTRRKVDTVPKRNPIPQRGEFKDLKALTLLQALSFLMAGYMVGYTLFWHKPSWIWYVATTAMGIFLSQLNIQYLGFKRTLALVYVLLLGLFILNASHLDASEQLFFICFFFTLFTMERWATVSFYKRSLPSDFSGIFTGMLIFSACAGLTGGFYLHSLLHSQFVLIAILLLLIIVNQTIYPERASNEAKNEPIVETSWGNAWLNSQQDAPLFSINTWMKYLQRTICELFFGKIKVRGLEHLSGLNGALLVANHPNTFFDPLLVSAVVPFKLKFLAKSTLWSIPVIGSLLDHLGLIPVQRAADGPRSRMNKNKQSLSRASALLNNGKTILIFPEGISQAGLTLKPLKTGAARIVFGALTASDWKKDTPILPIGLDYEKPSVFRSSVTIRIGAPVSLIHLQEAYSEEPKTQVRAVTKQLTSKLIELVPHLQDPEKEQLVHQISSLYGTQLCQFMKTDDANEARLAISQAVNHYCQTDPTSVVKLQERLQTYMDSRQHLELKANQAPITFKDMWAYTKAVFSPHMLGLVLHWLPYRLTKHIVGFMPLDYVWQATAKLVTGLVIYPLYYVLLNAVFSHFFGGMISYILMAGTALTGIMALGAFHHYDFLFQPIETLWNAFWRQDAEQDLSLMRTQLIQDLERFREAYAFYLEDINGSQISN